MDGRKTRKGAAGSVIAWVTERGGQVAADADVLADRISEAGGTPLLVAVEDELGARILGVIHLKDATTGFLGGIHTSAGPLFTPF